MMEDEQQAQAWLRSNGVSDAAMARLEQFIGLLRVENTRQNLVSASTLDHVWRRHIVDSAQLHRHVPRGTECQWMDLGTGAGFPGLVIAIIRDDIRMVVVESRRRRIEWLERVASELKLTNFEVVGQKLEAVPTSLVDVISARAFAPLETLLALACRFSTKRTLWLLPKGRSAVQEVEELHGWNHTFHVEPSITDPNAGIIVGRLAAGKG